MGELAKIQADKKAQEDAIVKHENNVKELQSIAEELEREVEAARNATSAAEKKTASGGGGDVGDLREKLQVRDEIIREFCQT